MIVNILTLYVDGTFWANPAGYPRVRPNEEEFRQWVHWRTQGSRSPFFLNIDRDEPTDVRKNSQPSHDVNMTFWKAITQGLQKSKISIITKMKVLYLSVGRSSPFFFDLELGILFSSCVITSYILYTALLRFYIVESEWGILPDGDLPSVWKFSLLFNLLRLIKNPVSFLFKVTKIYEASSAVTECWCCYILAMLFTWDCHRNIVWSRFLWTDPVCALVGLTYEC